MAFLSGSNGKDRSALVRREGPETPGAPECTRCRQARGMPDAFPVRRVPSTTTNEPNESRNPGTARRKNLKSSTFPGDPRDPRRTGSDAELPPRTRRIISRKARPKRDEGARSPGPIPFGALPSRRLRPAGWPRPRVGRLRQVFRRPWPEQSGDQLRAREFQLCPRGRAGPRRTSFFSGSSSPHSSAEERPSRRRTPLSHPVNEFRSLASRLSYFLWSSMPRHDELWHIPPVDVRFRTTTTILERQVPEEASADPPQGSLCAS